MSKNLDMIATVDIDITSPIVDDASFDKMLIVGPLPKVAPKDAPPTVGEYSSLDEVTAAGWVAIGENSDPIGVAARVAFSQKRKPSSIMIAPIQEVEGKLEKAVDTVTRACNTPGWYVVCTAGVDKSEYENIAKYIETKEKMFCYVEMDFFGAKSNAPTIGTEYARSFFIYGRVYKGQPEDEIPEENKYLNVGWLASVLNYAPGSETFAFKEIAACTPSELSTTDMNELQKHGTFFTKVGSKNVTLGGIVVAGEWIDIIRFRDWLKNDMQNRVVNIFVTTPKVPYTDGGIGLVQNQMLASLKAGQDVGGIANEEFDADGNSIPAYSTSVPLSSSLTAQEKASRNLKNCKFKARLAGAIHVADVDGSLTYTL